MKKRIFISIFIAAALGIVFLAGCGGGGAQNITAAPVTSKAANTISAQKQPTTAATSATAPAAVKTTAAKPKGTIKATLIQANTTGDTVTLPIAEVESNVNSKFVVTTGDGEMSFMAYVYDGKIQVRADICPPCRSESFSLSGERLVCDACGTVFKAENGAGVSGACVKYPKAGVLYTSNGSDITINSADLLKAYQETLERG